ALGTMTNANPEIHAMLAYGYEDASAFGVRNVYVRTSWGSGEGVYHTWNTDPRLAGDTPLQVRGVIGFHPHPRIRSIERNTNAGTVTLNWDGPSSVLSLYNQDAQTYSEARPHRYQIERSPTLVPAHFAPVGTAVTQRTITLPDCCDRMAFYRVVLIP